MKSLKKASLHLLIVAITILFFSESCYQLSSKPDLLPNATDAARKAGAAEQETEPMPNADVQTLTVSGMNYLIIRTPEGAIMANLTKDSLEVCIRKRNNLYLELTNKHLKTNQ